MATIQLTVVTPGVLGAVPVPSRLDRTLDEALNVLVWEGVVALAIAIVAAPFALVHRRDLARAEALPAAGRGAAARDVVRRGLASARPRFVPASVAMSASATTFSGRPEIWLALRNRANASSSLSPSRCMRIPFARSIAFRAANASASDSASSRKRGELLVPRSRRLDRREQVGLAERLHEVAEDTGLDRAGHELPLPVGRHHHDRDRALVEDPPRRLDPVEVRHLDVEERDVGMRLGREPNGLLAVTRLRADLEAGALEKPLAGRAG